MKKLTAFAFSLCALPCALAAATTTAPSVNVSLLVQAIEAAAALNSSEEAASLKASEEAAQSLSAATASVASPTVAQTSPASPAQPTTSTSDADANSPTSVGLSPLGGSIASTGVVIVAATETIYAGARSNLPNVCLIFLATAGSFVLGLSRF